MKMTMQRVPEPELMDAPDQVQAYSEADFAESNRLFVDQLLHMPSVLQFQTRPVRLVDLGCGPGDICLRLARHRPDWTIQGVDAGANMLKSAEAAARLQSMNNRVEFKFAHLPDPSLPQQHYQIVLSNSLLHHLPDPSVLWNSIKQLGATGASVQVMDLERPASEDQADQLVQRYAEHAPDVLKQDFFNSLKAAWTLDEVQAQVRAAGLTLEVQRISDRHWIAQGQLDH